MSLQAIKTLLQDKRVKKITEGDIVTPSNLVSMIQPMGTFNLGYEIRDVFWDEYCNYVIKSKNEDGSLGAMVGLAEKSDSLNPFIPVLVDVDIKVKEDDTADITSSLYTMDQVKTLAHVYQTILREIVDGIDDRHLACFVLEKLPYRIISSTGQPYIKHGFHMHFPWIFLDKADQECQLIPRVQKRVNELQLFLNLGFEDSGALIDKAYTHVPWLLYGSRKSEDMEPYLLSTIYDVDGNEIALEDALEGYRIYDVKNQALEMAGNEEFYLPRVLSIMLANRDYFGIKSNVQRMVRPKLKAKKRVPEQPKDDRTDEERIVEARKLVDMIHPGRAGAYETWMPIIFALYNSFCSNEASELAALDLAMKFSMQCPEKYNENELIAMWEKLQPRESGYTMRTLHHYAKLDNPAQYKVLLNEQLKSHVSESFLTQGTHTAIAKAMHKMFGNSFIFCANNTQYLWYEFENHGWKKLEGGGISLRKKISNDMVMVFRSMSQEVHEKLMKEADNVERTRLMNRIKDINSMIKNLETTPFKNAVMRECQDEFFDDSFLKKLDRNKYIIRFKNGVYDLQKHIFRDGLPEDYCFNCLCVDYVEFNETDSKVLEVQDFFVKIFPDKSLREYFLDTIASIFEGGNSQKKIYFWTGVGDNGKSVMQNMIMKLFGEEYGGYAKKLPTSLFTGKRTQSSSAAPELARIGNGERWLMAQEPDKTEVFNIGVCKELSGNDTFYARGLYSEGKEIQPMFKIAIVCNDPPVVPDNDKAFWNRIRLIPFESKFCDDAPDTFEEQLRQKRFPNDRSFSDKVPELLEALAWFLLQRRKNGLYFDEPEKVKMATSNYRLRNDFYGQFIDENLVEAPASSLSLTEIYSNFKEWYRDGFPSHTMPTKADLKEQLCKRFGEPAGVKGARWKGWRFATQADRNVINLNDEDTPISEAGPSSAAAPAKQHVDEFDEFDFDDDVPMP